MPRHSVCVPVPVPVFVQPDGFLHRLQGFTAFKAGVLDVPFAPHADNPNELLTMRDANGSIRIAKRGRVPITDADADREAQLLGRGSDGSTDSYRQILADINVMV